MQQPKNFFNLQHYNSNEKYIKNFSNKVLSYN